MRYDNKFTISLEHTIEDYLSLNLNENSSNDEWGKGIDIFLSRIQGRFLGAIELLLEDPQRNGFAIMALNCLLIETLHQFVVGENETGSLFPNHMLRVHWRIYSRFLTFILPNVFTTQKMAEKFYGDIRCGILHSAQTKGNSYLFFDNSNVIEMFNNHSIGVNVVEFSNRLRESIFQYCDNLLNSNIDYLSEYICRYQQYGHVYFESNIRLNFVSKMNYICNVEIT